MKATGFIAVTGFGSRKLKTSNGGENVKIFAPFVDDLQPVTCKG